MSVAWLFEMIVKGIFVLIVISLVALIAFALWP